MSAGAPLAALVGIFAVGVIYPLKVYAVPAAAKDATPYVTAPVTVSQRPLEIQKPPCRIGLLTHAQITKVAPQPRGLQTDRRVPVELKAVSRSKLNRAQLVMPKRSKMRRHDAIRDYSRQDPTFHYCSRALSHVYQIKPNLILAHDRNTVYLAKYNPGWVRSYILFSRQVNLAQNQVSLPRSDKGYDDGETGNSDGGGCFTLTCRIRRAYLEGAVIGLGYLVSLWGYWRWLNRRRK